MFKRLNDKRADSIKQGVILLEQWIKKTISSGIQMLERDKQLIEDIASRMVDYGMPGIARKLRIFEAKHDENEEWKHEFITLMGELLYLCEIIKLNKFEHELEIEDALVYIGVTIKKEEIKNTQNPIIDEWLYLGKTLDTEDKLKVHKYWFYGNTSRRYAQLIDFQIGPFGKERYYQIGNYYDALVHYYPSKTPLRIVDLESRMIKKKGEVTISSTTIPGFLDYYTNLQIQNPFINSCLASIKNVKLIQLSNEWYLKDVEGECIQLRLEENQIKHLFVYSSNADSVFIGEYKDKQFKIFSVCVQNKLIKL